MKAYFYGLMFFLVCSVGYCQIVSSNLSLIDDVEANVPSIIEKDYKQLGSVKNINFKTLTIFNITTGDSLKFIVVAINGLNNSSLFIRKSELRDFVLSARYMEDMYFKNIYKNYKEVRYKSKGGLVVGGYVDTDKSNVWARYIEIYKEKVFFQGPEFREAINYIDKLN